MLQTCESHRLHWSNCIGRALLLHLAPLVSSVEWIPDGPEFFSGLISTTSSVVIITARIAYLTSVLDVLLWTSTSSTSPSFPRSRALTLQFAVNKPLVWLCARECADFCFSQPKRKEGKCFLTPCTLISEFIFSILFSLHLLSDDDLHFSSRLSFFLWIFNYLSATRQK